VPEANKRCQALESNKNHNDDISIVQIKDLEKIEWQ
jgi:hypothetical protein